MKQKSFALIFVILTSGCAAMRMYTGEALPKEQVAVIKGSSKTYLYYNVMISIVSVDEELRTYPSPNKVEVMPGFHNAVIMIWVYENTHNMFLQLAARSFTDYYAFEFTAESGQQYKIETVDFLSFFRSTVPVPRSPLIAIVDINSGSVVARQPIDQHRLFHSRWHQGKKKARLPYSYLDHSDRGYAYPAATLTFNMQSWIA